MSIRHSPSVRDLRHTVDGHFVGYNKMIGIVKSRFFELRLSY